MARERQEATGRCWRRRAVASLATLALVGAILAAGGPGAQAKAKPSPKPAAKPKPSLLAFRARPSSLGYRGGAVVFTVKVEHATTCTFTGVVAKQVNCRGGGAQVKATIHENKLRGSRHFRESVTAKGPGGRLAPHSLIVIEGPAPRPSTTTRPPKTTTPTSTTTTPTTTTTAPATATSTSTTLPSGGSRSCSGPCKFTFPDPDVSGFVSVQLNQVTMGVPCPDAGMCGTTGSDELDAINVSLCAGTSGVPEGGLLAAVDLTLAVGPSDQGQLDSVTDDPNAATALGSYGPLAPGQCVTGDVYFDSPQREAWTSVEYGYVSSTTYDQTDYDWANG